MSSSSLSNPTLSILFLGHKLRQNQNTKNGITYFPIFTRHKLPRCALDMPYGEEEIWSARNFLLQQYAGHERSEESIEAAFENLLMVSFQHRKKTKINLKSRLKKKVEESPPWIKNLLNFVELPPMEVIFRRLFLFAFMGGWSIMNSSEGGPAFQVAVSLAACIYFLNEKTKSLARAFIIGLGALATGWICGSIFVPMIPTVLIHPTWTLELFLIAPPGTTTNRINENYEDEENDIDDSQRPPLLPEVGKNSSFAGVAVIA
ncbi:hypothetical protein CRYUN_Cryun13aG0024500 [Craigia yunnanensis]